MRGRWAEEEALRFLLGKGYRLLWRNRRTPFGEVDLFMEKDGVYVVVEVKQRASARFGAPLEAITPGKVRRLLQSARFLLGRDDLPVRLGPSSSTAPQRTSAWSTLCWSSKGKLRGVSEPSGLPRGPWNAGGSSTGSGSR